MNVSIYGLSLIALITGIGALAKLGIPNDTRTRTNWVIAISVIVIIVGIVLWANIGV